MSAIVLPLNTRPACWSCPTGGRAAFFPRGPRRYAGESMKKNRTRWESEDTWAARLFVGFNVGEKTVYDMDDLVELVQGVRDRQTGSPASSFVSQRGIYQHADGVVVDEPGAQVIIINMGEKPETFKRQMAQLAETIAREMQQEEVVVEIQRNGIVTNVMGVGV